MAREQRRRVRVLSYKRGSVSARSVARLAGLRMIRGAGRPADTSFVPRSGDLIVNWGNTGPFAGPYWMGTVRWLNSPSKVSEAIDKRRSLSAFTNANVPTVEYTTDVDVANRWLRDGIVVVQRLTASGMGGAGIDILDPTLTVNVERQGGVGCEASRLAQLWTKYFKRRAEYRVHVFGGEVVDVQQKRRRSGIVEADRRIRNFDNGWVYCRGGVEAPSVVLDASIAAVRALSLDFGAVDVGYNERNNQAAVFEVNTAPGIEGTTAEKYAAKLREVVAHE